MKEVKYVLTTSKLGGGEGQFYNLIVNKNVNYNKMLGN